MYASKEGDVMEISKDILTKAYRNMILIRKFEENLQKIYYDGKIPGFLHLYSGEEAIAVGVCLNLNKTDYVTSTHRAHGHFIAKGSDIKKIAAEIMGKKSGLCRGKGGSMHMMDMDNGLYGSTGIVGGGFPPAAGLALASKIKGTGQVSICFCGDGSINEGTFHESVNMAAIWNLPVVFVCENNLYAQSAPQEYHQKVKDIYIRSKGYGIQGTCVDGMDFFQVYDAARKAIERAREGKGPTLLECKTYLYSGHYVGDARAYRYPEEIKYYEENKDCINIFKNKVTETGAMSENEFINIESEVIYDVKEAVDFAVNSQFPDEGELLDNVY